MIDETRESLPADAGVTALEGAWTPRILPASKDPTFAVVVYDTRGGVRALSESAQQLFGQRASDLHLNRSVGAIACLEDGDNWFTTALRGEIVAGEQVLFERDTLRPLVLTVSAAPTLDDTGDVTGVTAVFADVTDAQRATEAQQILTEAGQVLASSLDTETTIREAARLFIPRLADWCLIAVREDDDSIRLAAVAHSDPELAQAAVDAFEQGRPTLDESDGIGNVIRTGIPLFMPDAGAQVRAALARDPEQADTLNEFETVGWMVLPLTTRGHTLGAICFVSRQLRRPYDPVDLALAEELSRRVATAIDNATLYGKARSAIEARDGVLGIVAHDLRNPVGTIQMTTDLLLEGILPDDARDRYYGIIRRATDRMKHLIQDLLDAASIDAGHLSLQLAPTAIPSLLDEVQETFAAEVKTKLQRLEFEAGEALPTISMDRGRMIQVFVNLIGNAVKFTPEGGLITVRVSTLPEALQFTVADSGVGIGVDEIEHVFDRFWQSRRARRGGAGLGLAIAKGIVEAHGGSINVASVAGEGTTFTFVLPVLAFASPN